MSTFNSPPSAPSSATPVVLDGTATGSTQPGTTYRDARKRDAASAESRGSVLVFVVGILLLLAIIATAFLGTSRTDRTATQQNALNTQIDLLVEGVVNTAKATISSDESLPGSANFEPFDAYTTARQVNRPTNDNWLASRVPTTTDPLAIESTSPINIPTAAGLGVEWPVITGGLLTDRFESPLLPQKVNAGQTAYTGGFEYSQREALLPTYVSFQGKNWPAFIVDTFSTPVPGLTGAAGDRYRVFMAGDADGDGVADSGLVRLPIGQIAGVTYYAAVRIIDNSSALNLNTAMSRDWEFDGAGNGSSASYYSEPTVPAVAQYSGAFPSSVGLVEILRSGLNRTTAPVPPGEFDKMSTNGVNEFTALNAYRLGFAKGTTSVRPNGVLGAALPLPQYTANGQRADFSYGKIGEMLSRQLTERMSNPGYTAGTYATPTAAKNAFRDSLLLASRFSIGSTDDGSNELVQAMETSVLREPNLVAAPAVPTANVNARTKPYTGLSANEGIDQWFYANFSFMREWAVPINLRSPVIFRNRRTLLTGYNATSNAETSGQDPIPPARFWSSVALDAWAGPTNNVVYAQHTADRTLVPAAAAVPAASPVLAVAPMMIPNNPGGPTVGAQAKVDINTARFEELFFGFFKTMARPGFLGLADNAGTPFSSFFNSVNTLATARYAVAVNVTDAGRIFTDSTVGTPGNPPSGPGQYYRDPYIGMRFNAQVGPVLNATTYSTNRVEPPGLASVVNGQIGAGQETAEQHPLRQFRSVLRAPHDRASLNPVRWSNNTPYLPADQVLLLRSAIAAANAEALRNSSIQPSALGATSPLIPSDGINDRINPHEIPLVAYMPATNDVDAPAVATNVVAHVYGLRRQPYITEVYVNTDPRDPTYGPDPALQNLRGYIAIKIYNPHPIPISLENCRLVGLRKYRESVPQTPVVYPPPTGVTVHEYPNITVTPAIVGNIAAAPTVMADEINLNQLKPNDGGDATPWIIPANGSLVIENYPSGAPAAPPVDSPGTDATHRPMVLAAVAGLGLPSVGPATPAVPASVRVAYLPHLTTICYDRELVLMRPLNATPPNFAITPVGPLTYTNEDATRPRVDRMAPLDSFDFTGLTYITGSIGAVAATEARLWHYVRPHGNNDTTNWNWVYPGRYDGNQSIPLAAVPHARPRQQGTEEAYAATGALTLDVSAPGNQFTILSRPITLTAVAAPTDNAFYPDRFFNIQLNVSGWPSTNNLHSLPAAALNQWPYGGFRRLGDLQQVPFIGSYTIQTETNAATAGTTADILEMNAVTMDAALAEDTDPNDNPLATDNGSQSREQIGRFTPLRPSFGGGNGTTNGLPAVESQDVTGGPNDPPRHSVFYLNSTVGPAATRQNFIDYDTTNPTNPYGGATSGFARGDFLRYQDDMDDVEYRSTFSVQMPTANEPYPPLNTNQTWTNRYHWTRSLFDHFTINAPHSDTFAAYPTQPKWRPGVDYVLGDAVQYGSNIYVYVAAPGQPIDVDEPPTSITPNASNTRWQMLERRPVQNGTATTPGDRLNLASGISYDYLLTDDNNEATEPSQGLININTAPAKVLATLPWVRPGDNYSFNYIRTTWEGLNVVAGGDGIPDNEQVAVEIALWRDGRIASAPGTWTLAPANAPIRNLFDLYQIPVIRQLEQLLITAPGSAGNGPGILNGDFSPYDLATMVKDPIFYDFEKQYLILNRVSNLITTRSDTYTLYVLVQGWRNVGTQNPELVTQRRVAVMVDRSRMTEGGTETLKQLSKIQSQ